MSTGYFSRTGGRNTPQRTLNKSQQASQEIINPIQIKPPLVVEQPSKSGYVYKPPARIVRSNINQTKQIVKEKVEKVEQKIIEVKYQISQQLTTVRSSPFIRKPQNNSTPKLTKEVQDITQSEVKQVKQELKPVVAKPISRLNANKEISTLQATTKIQQKDQQDNEPTSRQTSILDIKKPLPYSYSRKIVQKGLEIETQQPEQQQQKQNTLSQMEQKSQQTSKFNRLQRKIQKAPVTSSPYQRKPVSQPQSSQSATTLRNFEAKQQSNKIQIVSNEQQNVQKNHVLKPQIKRSNLIIFSLHKITVQKYQAYFQQICDFSRLQKETKQNEKTQKQFQKVLLKICSRYQNGLTQNSFGLMKSIYSKILKIEMTKSTDSKVSNQLIAKRNQCFIKVLENITPNELTQKRQALNKLKINSIKQGTNKKKILHGARVLCNQESRRLKQCLNLIFQWSNVRNIVKSIKLGRSIEISKNLRKQMLFWSFRKMETFKLKQQNEQAQKETLLDANKQLREKIQQLELRLSELKQNKKQNPDEEEQLRNTMNGLKQESQGISQELKIKRQKNKQLKQKIDQLMTNKPFSSQQELSSISENKIQGEEGTLSLLHEIYMKAFKQTEEQCVSEENILQLCIIHKVEENQSTRETVAQWIAVENNLFLKHWINLYEGIYVSGNLQGEQQLNSSQVRLQAILSQRKQQCRRLEEENEIIKKFIRSYIKERYMWEEVKQYVAAAVNQ